MVPLLRHNKPAISKTLTRVNTAFLAPRVSGSRNRTFLPLKVAPPSTSVSRGRSRRDGPSVRPLARGRLAAWRDAWHGCSMRPASPSSSPEMSSCLCRRPSLHWRRSSSTACLSPPTRLCGSPRSLRRGPRSRTRGLRQEFARMAWPLARPTERIPRSPSQRRHDAARQTGSGACACIWPVALEKTECTRPRRRVPHARSGAATRHTRAARALRAALCPPPTQPRQQPRDDAHRARPARPARPAAGGGCRRRGGRASRASRAPSRCVGRTARLERRSWPPPAPAACDTLPPGAGPRGLRRGRMGPSRRCALRRGRARHLRVRGRASEPWARDGWLTGGSRAGGGGGGALATEAGKARGKGAAAARSRVGERLTRRGPYHQVGWSPRTLSGVRRRRRRAPGRVPD